MLSAAPRAGFTGQPMASPLFSRISSIQPATSTTRRRLRLLLRITALALVSFLIWFVAMTWSVVRAHLIKKGSPLVVNDVSQLNPIQVNEVISPTSTAEIVDAVKRHSGPISIGGARHSMGGQIATAGALFIDMRQFNRILNFSPADKTITVQAGAPWRQNPEHIDSRNPSGKNIQTSGHFPLCGPPFWKAPAPYCGRRP